MSIKNVIQSNSTMLISEMNKLRAENELQQKKNEEKIAEI